LEETHQTIGKNFQDAQANQMKYGGGKEVVFEVGDRVWLSTRHFQMT
jgi:Mor family transcriptional regulator